jgi:hypothetical protein
MELKAGLYKVDHPTCGRLLVFITGIVPFLKITKICYASNGEGVAFEMDGDTIRLTNYTPFGYIYLDTLERI